jgi:dipeptidyl aminopeptidase/acylaminoacyl peptidase
LIDFTLPKSSKRLSKKYIVVGSKTKCKKPLIKPFIIAIILGFVIVFEVFSSTLSVEDFVSDAKLFDVALSPNGKYLAEIIQQGKVRHIRVKDISLPDWPTIGNIGDNILRADGLVWVNDNRLLVSLVVPGKTKEVRENSEQDEDFDIYEHGYITKLIVMDKDGKNAHRLFEGKRYVGSISLRNVQHYLPNDPEHILLRYNRTGRRVLYKYNVINGEHEIIARGTKYTYGFVNGEDGSLKFRIDYLYWLKKIYIYSYTDKNEWEKIDTLYLDQDDQDSIKVDGFVGTIGEKLIYRTYSEKTGFYELSSISRTDGSKEVIVSLPDQDVSSLVINSRTKETLGYTIEIDNVRFNYFDKDRQINYDEVSTYFDGNNFSFSHYSKVTNTAVVTFWGPDNPGGYALYNYTTKKMALLGYSFTKLATERLSLPAVSTYKTRDGVKIRNYILLPNDYKKGVKLPMVVLPHGGPQHRSRSNYNDFAQFLSTRGYIVIQPNFRGSTGYGKAFEEAGYKQWGQLMQDDITDGVNFMVEKGFADPKKVCIVGLSYGGYAALMGAIRTPTLYQCAISINGVTHLRDQIEFDIEKFDDEAFIEKYILRRIGDPEIDKIMLDKNSPAIQAEKINIPLLIIAGKYDNVVPIEQSKDLIDELEDHNKKFKYIEVDDAGHSIFDDSDDTELVYKEIETFLQKFLLSDMSK